MQFTAEMIASLISGEVVGDKNAAVHTVSSIEDGKAGGLAYLSNPKYEQFLYTTQCSIVLVLWATHTLWPHAAASLLLWCSPRWLWVLLLLLLSEHPEALASKTRLWIV